jgi:hypothetical protein
MGNEKPPRLIGALQHMPSPDPALRDHPFSEGEGGDRVRISKAEIGNSKLFNSNSKIKNQKSKIKT